MRHGAILLFLAMCIAGVIAFSGAWDNSPVYTNAYMVTAYEFAAFLFWVFLALFLLMVVLAAVLLPFKNKVEPSLQIPPDYRENLVTGGFITAIILIVTGVIAGIFGFGAVASTFSGLALVMFWISVILAVAAFAMAAHERSQLKR